MDDIVNVVVDLLVDLGLYQAVKGRPVLKIFIQAYGPDLDDLKGEALVGVILALGRLVPFQVKYDIVHEKLLVLYERSRKAAQADRGDLVCNKFFHL